MATMEGWDHSLFSSAMREATAGVATAERNVMGFQRNLQPLAALYAQFVEMHGVSSPQALKVRDMLQVAREGLLSAHESLRATKRLRLRLMLKAVERVTILHVCSAEVWRLLLEIFTDGGPRKNPPLEQVHESLDVPEGVSTWAPWTGLAPPVVPALVQRQ